MFIRQFYTNCLAQAAYYVESKGEALIIDPLRDTKPYLDLAQERGAKIRHILETHFHADFVSGHLELARQTGAIIIYGGGARPRYRALVANDGEVLSLGEIRIRILHTPGHTLESCCFLLLDEQGKEYCLFTGDTLFAGDVGRPDLMSGNLSKETLASMLYDSLNKKIMPLADNLIIYPGHGPGSACGKHIGRETVTTLGEQKRTNYALMEQDRDAFILKITEGLVSPPAYFFKDAGINANGYQPLEEVMLRAQRQLLPEEWKKAALEGAVLLDTRTAEVFAKGHVKGAINIGLNGDFAVWAGTLLPFDNPIVLFTEKGSEKESITRLARIGYDSILGCAAVPDEAGEQSRVELVYPETFRNVVKEGKYVILDVRRPAETEKRKLKNAMLMPLAELPQRFQELNKEDRLLICCAGGYRSMIAASFLNANGFEQTSSIAGGIDRIEREASELVTHYFFNEKSAG
jgi:glyoxylase-like metal-dependent hydrolase (beta-lactamase superfamily II)